MMNAECEMISKGGLSFAHHSSIIILHFSSVCLCATLW
jgi:hypothetical protein